MNFAEGFGNQPTPPPSHAVGRAFEIEGAQAGLSSF